MNFIVAFVVCLVSWITHASLRTEADMREYDAHVTERKRAHACEQILAVGRLAQMYEIDQYMRIFSARADAYPVDERAEFWAAFHPRCSAVDHENTAEIKRLLADKFWFNISTYGEEADRHAWLIVQHADDDPAFQREIVGRLSELYLRGETRPKNYAMLCDRVAVSHNFPAERTLQRYGTQGQCLGPGRWEPFPIEDPDHIDERRKAVGLGPFAESFARTSSLCQ